MPLSWNEIRRNAHDFAREWADETHEEAEAKSFWDGFFSVFGIRRRTVASFEEPVRRLSGHWGFIDLFWPGTLLVEHKSRGRSLEAAGSQALEYVRGLKDSGRDDEVPRYVLVSDFARIALHDLEDGTSLTFALKELPRNVHAFAFVPGYKRHRLDPEDPINVRAVELLGDLRDALAAGGYVGHDLERFLVRILFCLFADDTGIFDRNAFSLYVENHTRPDGSDLGAHLARLFDVLDTPPERRQASLVEELAELPHVNGELFRERLAFADFDRTMREQLLRCTRFDWSRISPAVFGSLFQSVMDGKERRRVGAHYTSERDILKVIGPLFLDALRDEFESLRRSRERLRRFHARLGSLTFLDPACGCGNFLVVAYRELRRLELDVLRALHGRQQVIDVRELSVVDVDAFFGIEINEFPARIAEVAMWLVDHQMNQELSEAFGQYFVRLPLRKSATVVHGNALRIDWHDVVPPQKCSYVLGNPPFVGAKYQSPAQRADMQAVCGDLKGSGLLDYVCGWHLRAADYVRDSATEIAFVSTNSISQGEQVSVLWGALLKRGMRIRFAHRTFAWTSEARGRAHVHVVVVGFGRGEPEGNGARRGNGPWKRLFEYDADPRTATCILAQNISPYLVDGPDVLVAGRSRPLCPSPDIGIGNKPIDDGNYLFLPEERKAFLETEPAARKWFRRWIGSKEFLNSLERWCLWLGDCPPRELRAMPECLKRVRAVRSFREASGSVPTRRLAETPTRFHVENMPAARYLVVPKVSSERRRYVPMGFVPPSTLASDLCFVLPNATIYDFGVLASGMHMVWVRHVCGRLKSDFRYSIGLVYNNFPWPDSPVAAKKTAVERAARDVLGIRDGHSGASLADLYDPETMPQDLARAHARLDRAVEACYRAGRFRTDRERIEFLFVRYEQLVAAADPGSETADSE